MDSGGVAANRVSNLSLKSTIVSSICASSNVSTCGNSFHKCFRSFLQTNVLGVRNLWIQRGWQLTEFPIFAANPQIHKKFLCLCKIFQIFLHKLSKLKCSRSYVQTAKRKQCGNVRPIADKEKILKSRERMAAV